MDTATRRGVVKNWSDNRGFGFIEGRDSEDYFAHYSEINMDGYKTLTKGEKVSYEPYTIDGRPRARNIRRLAEATTTTIKTNPFNPLEVTYDPKHFSGRAAQIIDALSHLANRGNILLIGDRGIGKSSVLAQLENICRGETYLLDHLKISLDADLDYLVAHHVCQQEHTLSDIVTAIATDLEQAMTAELSEDKTEEKRKLIEVGFEYIIKFRREVETVTRPLVEIPASFKGLLKHVAESSGKNGICISIDEIDVLSPDIGLTSFLRATREQLGNDAKVVFMLCGVTEGAQRVAAEHRSHRRVFEQILVDAMKPTELEEILHNHLEGTGVTIDPDVAKNIVRYAGSYPYVVQYLGHHCFQQDTDNQIASDDLSLALDRIINELRINDFESLRDQAQSETYDEIIKLLADHDIDSLTPAKISAHVGLTPHQVGPMLKKLKLDNIVTQTMSGNYQIYDPLFKVYCRWYGGEIPRVSK